MVGPQQAEIIVWVDVIQREDEVDEGLATVGTLVAESTVIVARHAL